MYNKGRYSSWGSRQQTVISSRQVRAQLGRWNLWRFQTRELLHGFYQGVRMDRFRQSEIRTESLGDRQEFAAKRAADGQNFDGRRDLAASTDRLEAFKLRHYQVCDYDCDLRIEFQLLKCFTAICRFNNDETLAAQNRCKHTSHVVLVVNQKDAGGVVRHKSMLIGC